MFEPVYTDELYRQKVYRFHNNLGASVVKDDKGTKYSVLVVKYNGKNVHSWYAFDNNNLKHTDGLTQEQVDEMLTKISKEKE